MDVLPPTYYKIVKENPSASCSSFCFPAQFWKRKQLTLSECEQAYNHHNPNPIPIEMMAPV